MKQTLLQSNRCCCCCLCCCCCCCCLCFPCCPSCYCPCWCCCCGCPCCWCCCCPCCCPAAPAAAARIAAKVTVVMLLLRMFVIWCRSYAVESCSTAAAVLNSASNTGKYEITQSTYLTFCELQPRQRTTHSSASLLWYRNYYFWSNKTLRKHAFLVGLDYGNPLPRSPLHTQCNLAPAGICTGSVLGYDTIWNGRLRTDRLESTWQPSNLIVVPNLLCAPMEHWFGGGRLVIFVYTNHLSTTESRSSSSSLLL